MKKSNLITKTLILLVAITVYSFTTKTVPLNKEKTKSTINIISYVLVYHPNTSTISKKNIRNCFLFKKHPHAFGIISITQCPDNINAEIVKVLPSANPTNEEEEVEDNFEIYNPYNNLAHPATSCGLISASIGNSCESNKIIDHNINR